MPNSAEKAMHILAVKTGVIATTASSAEIDQQQLDERLGFAWSCMQQDVPARAAWLVWRLWQLGARQGNTLLLRCLAGDAESIARAIDARGYIKADLSASGFTGFETVSAIESAELLEKPRWTYDFIVDVWRGQEISTADLDLYGRIGAGGVFYTGPDDACVEGKRWHDLAAQANGFTLRHRHIAPFDDDQVEEFYSLDG